MASSLDKLSSNLKMDQFVNLKKYYSGNHISLLLRKGVYTYDYVDCMKKFDETSLPSKEAFCHQSFKPSFHPSGIKTGHNSKVLGMFKDEAGEKQIVEFVGLRDNYTLIKSLMALNIKKCKG